MRRRVKKIYLVLIATLPLYGALAYVLLPEFWTLRDRALVATLGTFLTTTPQDIPGDPINIGLIGSKSELVHAMASAGWNPADAISFRSALEIGESVTFDRAYADAPVSTLLLAGEPQDLAFEKPAGVSADRRNHVRFWQTQLPGEDRPLWMGAASFNRGVGFSHDTGQITHHIDADIDAERDDLVGDLDAVGAIASRQSVEGIGPTKTGRNGGGDPYFTDGFAVFAILQQPTVAKKESLPSSPPD